MLDFGSVAPWCEGIAREPREVAVFAYLDAGDRVVASRHLRSAHADLIDLPIRRIVRDAILFRADRVVMAHNHPSGIAQPSAADIAATRQLARALKLFEMHLSDHWIVTHDDAVSLSKLGLM